MSLISLGGRRAIASRGGVGAAVLSAGAALRRRCRVLTSAGESDWRRLSPHLLEDIGETLDAAERVGLDVTPGQVAGRMNVGGWPLLTWRASPLD